MELEDKGDVIEEHTHDPVGTKKSTWCVRGPIAAMIKRKAHKATTVVTKILMGMVLRQTIWMNVCTAIERTHKPDPMSPICIKYPCAEHVGDGPTSLSCESQ